MTMTQDDREVVVETAGLLKVFKDFWGRDKVAAVNDLDVRIFAGEVFGLLGPNGSGKTTTIKLLLGLLYPTRGVARVFGKDPSNVDVKSRIGYLPEETRLYQFLDSWETLDFYGRVFKLAGAERARRSEALIEMVGLGAAASRSVGQYSKGMARRIGLAQSLINDPDLLILDEPTAGMDPIGTRQIKDLILELKNRGKTILLSSHLLSDVEDVCDRVAIMYGGRLLCCGEIEELLARQHTTEVLMDNLSADEVEDLQGLMAERFGDRVVSVGNPRDRLERFFLRMVEQAQQQQISTSGALAGGGVSEFLRSPKQGEKGKALLEQLVASGEADAGGGESEAAVQPVEKQVSEAVRTGVLDDLADDRLERPARIKPGVEAVKRVDKPDKPDKGDDVDRSILDGLTADPDRPGRETQSGGSEG